LKQEFFKENRKRLLEIIPDNSVCIIFSGKPIQKSADEMYSFAPNRNFYYLTGLTQDNVVLILSRTNKKTKEGLWLESNNPQLARWVGSKIEPEEATKISGISTVDKLENLESYLHRELMSLPYPDVYLDLERRSFNDVTSYTQFFASNLITKYPYIRIQNVYPMICDLRRVKTPEEIQQIRKAIEITHLGLDRIVKNCKPGMKEYELEAHFDYVLKANGIREHAFHTIAASGINAATLHYNENNCESQSGDLILLDLGAQYEWYNADITRTFPVNGKFSPRQKDLYQIVLDTQHQIIEKIKPGIPFTSLNEHCKAHLCKCCQSIGLIHTETDLFEYYFHGVSHFLGLDTHDVGKAEELRPGMVVTVEPGLYLRSENIGIRIEDDVLVTDTGHENLSKKIPKSITEIEAWMEK
jgi:Xaa-Pro aminopeptidase